ncbi:hypothetical protein [Kribbella sp. NPDC004875]|uniref:hypothetical protein n=1 Tax=Kribbella sp. NPDC004875 TaxID=3364107 RepID=UPI0036CD9738
MTPIVLRPSIASAGGSFWYLLGQYGVLIAILCVSLAAWAVSPAVAAVLFVVLLAATALVFWTAARGAELTVDDASISYRASGWGVRKVLPRGQVRRVLLVDRFTPLMPGALVLLAADGNRIAAPRWLWPTGTLEEVAALTGLPIERRATMRAMDLPREIGVDPALRQRGVRFVLTRLVTSAVGILIAWPLIARIWTK